MLQPVFEIPIDYIKDIITSDDNFKIIIILVILSLGVIIPNVKTSYDLFESFSKRKLSVLKASLIDGQVTKPIKKVIQEQVDLIVFRHATGIKDYNNIRKQIIELYEFANGRLTYLDFKRAYAFLEYKVDNSLEVRKISFWDRIYQVYMALICISFIFSFSYLTSLLFFYPIQIFIKIILIPLILYSAYIIFFTMIQTQLISIAKKNQDELRKKKRKDFEDQERHQLSLADSSCENTKITERIQLDFINSLLVLKPATKIVNREYSETAVQDMREERIKKFMSW